MPLRELNRGPPVQRAPDLFAGAMFGEPEIPDAHYDIEPVTRSLHLPRLGARRAVHGPPKRARRVATTEAEVGHVRRASQELDRLGPHAVAILQRGATVQAVGDFRAIAEVGQGPERARRLHRRLLSPPAPPPHGRRGLARLAGPVSLPHVPLCCQFCRHCFSPWMSAWAWDRAR